MDYVFFYSGPFSQWHIAPITIRGRTYNCCEQYMMMSKAAIFADTMAYVAIEQSEHPAEQKKLGRLVKGFDQCIWDIASVDIVFQANMAKFTQHKDLYNELMNSEGTLVEASPHDRVWGIGFSADNAMENTREWGANRLGLILTDIRETLKKPLDFSLVSG